MKIIGLSQNIIWKDKHRNFLLIEEKFQNLEADLFLLPEMFSTGFCMEATEVADAKNETLFWMKSLAKAKNAAIAGSISVKDNGNFYNRFYSKRIPRGSASGSMRKSLKNGWFFITL